MNIKVKEINLRYGLLEVERRNYGVEPCVVMRKDNTLYFRTEIGESIEELFGVVDGYEWKCGVNRFKRIVEKLSAHQETVSEGATFSPDSDNDEFDIRFEAPCGEEAFVKLSTLKEIAEQFCGNGESKDS